MRKVTIVLALLSIVLASTAQEEKEERKGGFKKENLFTGGNVTVSFFSGGTSLGISPYFGYSINKYVDVAVSGNLNYTSQRDYQYYGDKIRQTVYGPGAFVRLFPVNFLFAQVQYEHNFIKVKYYAAPNSFYTNSTYTVDANSVLVGAGYTSGRQHGNSTYYYLSVLWDVSKVSTSPYVDGLGRNFPIIRAGYNIALFQGKRGRY